MSGIARGSGLKMFYSYAHKNEPILAVQADIKKPADLRGKKLGIEGKFGYSHLGMLSVIQPAGVTDKDVTYVRTTPPQRVSFIISGKVDAVLMHIERVAFASKKTKGKASHPRAHLGNTARLPLRGRLGPRGENQGQPARLRPRYTGPHQCNPLHVQEQGRDN